MNNYEWNPNIGIGQEDCKYDKDRIINNKYKVKSDEALNQTINEEAIMLELDSMEVEMIQNKIAKETKIEVMQSRLASQSQTQIVIYDEQSNENENQNIYVDNPTQSTQPTDETQIEPHSIFPLNSSFFFQSSNNPKLTSISVSECIVKDNRVTNYIHQEIKESKTITSGHFFGELNTNSALQKINSHKKINLYDIPRDVMISVFSYLTYKETFQMIPASKLLSNEIAYYQEYMIDSISNHPNTIARFGFKIETDYIYYTKVNGTYLKASLVLDKIFNRSPNLKLLDLQNTELVNDNLIQKLTILLNHQSLSNLSLAKSNIMQGMQSRYVYRS